MKARIFILYISIFYAFTGCEKAEFNTNNNDLTGFWIKPQVNDTLVSFEKANKFSENEYGILFKADGKLIERKNSGWCGTPPVSYADFDGNWEELNTIISINVDYWGGKANYLWKIVAIDDNTLTIYRISEAYQH